MERPADLVVVTGSTGFIGSALLDRLVSHYRIVGLAHREVKRQRPGVAWMTADLTSDEDVRRVFATIRERHGQRIASFVHLAAYYDFSGEPSPLYENLTVKGTARILRELRAFAVEQFIFSSTMLVHVPCRPGERINEDWPIAPAWAYPRSKAETEEVIRLHRGEIPAVLMRIAGVYDDECHSIPIAHQIQRIDERRFTGHLFPGDPDRGQTYVHLDDLTDAFVRLIERRASLPVLLPLLIGEPEPVSYGALQERIGRLLYGEDWTTLQIPEPVATAGAWAQDVLPAEDPFIKPWMIDRADDHYALDISRARALLGWEPHRSLLETLPAMVAALKADPRAWYRANDLEVPEDLQPLPEHGPAGEAHTH